MSTSCWPASIGWPPTSASTVATRHMLWMGVTQRMNSSVATDRSAPALSAAHWSGWAMRSRIVRAMTVRVVSAPPSSSSRQSEMTVSTVSGSPSTSAVGPDRHDVVGRAARLLGVQVARRLGELHGREHAVLVEVAGAAAHGDRALGPVLQLGPALLGEAEQPGDGHGRQGSGELVDDLGGAAAGLDRVDQAADRGADVVLAGAHRPRGEPAGHQVAALVVQRVVEADDRRVGGDVRAGSRPWPGRS